MGVILWGCLIKGVRLPDWSLYREVGFDVELEFDVGVKHDWSWLEVSPEDIARLDGHRDSSSVGPALVAAQRHDGTCRPAAGNLALAARDGALRFACSRCLESDSATINNSKISRFWNCIYQTCGDSCLIRCMTGVGRTGTCPIPSPRAARSLAFSPSGPLIRCSFIWCCLSASRRSLSARSFWNNTVQLYPSKLQTKTPFLHVPLFSVLARIESCECCSPDSPSFAL